MPATISNTFPTRKFGIEVEFVGISRQAACTAIRAAGVPCNVEEYGHSVPSQWKLVTDGSVHGNGGGGELVSPPLSGEAGLDQVRTVLRAMAAAGATVNVTCGLHVHVDANDLAGVQIANVFRRYADHESLINMFMPRSRQDNTYCKSLARYYGTGGLTSLLDRIVRDPRVAATSFDRYHTVNLASYYRQGTVEFRHHSGSVNATKVTSWIVFCVNFVQASATLAQPATTAGASSATAPRRTRGRQTNFAARRRLVEMLRGPLPFGGLSLSSIAQATGYSESTINVLFSNLRNRRQDGGRVADARVRFGRVRSFTVYRADALAAWCGAAAPATTTAPAAAPVSNERPSVDSLFAGMPAEIRSFYSERAMELSGSVGWV